MTQKIKDNFVILFSGLELTNFKFYFNLNKLIIIFYKKLLLQFLFLLLF